MAGIQASCPERAMRDPRPDLEPLGPRLRGDERREMPRGARVRATKPGSVPPGPAGVVLVNTLFWKILVTRVNGKMRGRKRSFGCRAASVSDGQQSPIFFAQGDYRVR